VGRAEGAAAVLKQAEGKSEGFGLAAFFLTHLKTFQATYLTALLPAQPKNLAASHAAAEVVGGDPTHGADLRNSAAAN